MLSLVLVAGLGTPAFAQLPTPQTASTVEINRPQIDEDNVIFNGGTASFAATCPLQNGLLCIDDFQLNEDAVLADVHLDVFQQDSIAQPIPGFTAEFSYVIIADNGGIPGALPGALIQEGEGINEHKETIDDFNFRYWFDLDNPILLQAGTTYWIGVFVTNAGGNIIDWWTTDTVFGNPGAFTGNQGASWTTFIGEENMNLVLTGEDDVVGGEFLPIETTSLLLAGAQTFSWMIPVVLSVLGIGLFVASRKSENS